MAWDDHVRRRGGGGGNGTSEGALVASAIQPSASGAYTWLITSQGLSDTKTNGLSLIHPAAPAIRHEIEPITSALIDLVPVLSGTLDAGVPAVRDIKPHSLLYIVDGDVRRIPLQANGSAPISSLKSALVNTACRFIIHANDYSATQGLSGASLLAYDTATRAIRTLGTLPGTSDFGDDFVFAAITPSASDFMAGFAGRVVSGVLKADNIKTLTFDITAQGSLRIPSP